MSKHRRSGLPKTPVRSSISDFIPHLDLVSINRDQIDELANDLLSEDFPLPAWRAPVFPDSGAAGVSESDVIDFLFLGNAINFQFRDFETGDKFTAKYSGTDWHGAFGMWACLKREFDENPAILSGRTLASLSLDDVRKVFRPADDREMPMLQVRHRILTEVGDHLMTHYDGRFSNLVADSTPRLFDDGNGIVDSLVSDIPSFRDGNTLVLEDGTELSLAFLKRAQLAAGMCYGRFQDDDVFRINDPDAFTVFVDYNLPNVLRGLDVLEYSTPLARMVDSRREIDAGSRMELEIRAATVHAADGLLDRLSEKRDSPIYAPHIDYKLFEMRDEVDSPPHRTRTTAY